MLNYNFPRLFRARAIDKPYAFLTSHGFSDDFASRVKRNLVKRLNHKEMEKLCIVLNCTPNDLLEWTDDEGYHLDNDHPMRKLLKTDKMTDLNNTVLNIPLDRIEEINQLINDNLKENKNHRTD